MRIASYNVNGINGRLPVLLTWLAERAPDVVCLQELKAAHDNFPEAALAEAGYCALWQGQKSWNGVAILSKSPLVEIARRLPGEDTDKQARYLEAAIDGLIVACLYAPNGNPAPGPKFDYKLRWLERLRARAAEFLASGAPVALVGDFNIIPSERDVYKPERWQYDALFRAEVRAAFAALTAEGWIDSLRARHPDETIFTFWDYFRNAYGRDAGLRIDHLLLSPPLARRLADAGVDRDVRGLPKSSDHAPVWIDLKPARAIRGKAKR